MKKILILITCLLIPFLSANTVSAASYADVVFVVDQTGSMNDEFAWLESSISSISGALTTAGITTNYGLAGYEYFAGNEPDTSSSYNNNNVFVDINSSITTITDAIPDTTGLSAFTYGSTERGYHAADWARTGFNWTGGNYAKVIVLITDEPADQGSGISESALGAAMVSGKFLLNVIAPSDRRGEWDDAVYYNGKGTSDISDDYYGIFDLAYLNSDPTGFTADFTAAKLSEIQQHQTTVPEPATMVLFGIGLIGLAGVGRKKS